MIDKLFDVALFVIVAGIVVYLVVAIVRSWNNGEVSGWWD